MHWLASRLARRFAVATAGGLLASSLIFLIIFLALYRTELATEQANAAQQVNRLLQTSLENAMLKRDLEGLGDIVQRLGRQPGIEAVFITNPKGEIRFASKTSLLGQQETLANGQRTSFTRFVSNGEGRDLLRSVNPVANRPQCKECHGPMELSPINGVLYVDYDAAPIRQRAQNTTLLLMGSGAIIVLLNIGGGWWFLQRYVLTPVGQLTRSSQSLAQGDLSQRAATQGTDELAQLGQAFNRMADQLQERIDESEHQRDFLQALLDAVPDGVRVIDRHYRVTMTNQAYRQQLGLGDTDGVGDTCHRISHQSDRPCPSTLITCPVHEIGRTGQPLKVLHRHFDAGGNVSDVEINAAPLPTMVDGHPETLTVECIRDLSKQIRYSHEQRLSELGRVATGVAHEIHNPLASMRLALDGLRRNGHELDGEMTEYLALVDNEIDKCLIFTERLLRLGMQPPEEPELVEVTSVVEDTLGLLRWEAEEHGISTSIALEPGLRVMASDPELRVVFLNLIQNAFHAMPKGGQLALGSRRVEPLVEITVRDTGVGIDPERLPRIFDPFFSRRADGVEGTGLGLSIVRTIVETYGGSVEVESTVGQGSEFKVLLPDADHSAQGET
jgi:signal transduction histidine kinase/HAMP domain-containing protein